MERSVLDVLADLVRHPLHTVVRRWNWKSALLSSTVRGLVFFAVNLQSGWDAGVHALGVEFLLRTATSGFYGAITQAFRRVHPVWAGSLVAMALLPALGHSIEFVVHLAAGTPQLLSSVAVSAVFTVFSTLFNLHAMRHGVLIVGEGSGSLADDCRRLPAVILDFLGALPRAVMRLAMRPAPDEGRT